MAIEVQRIRIGKEFTGAQIKAFRKKRGFELKHLQSALREHLGADISLSTLSRMETGRGRGPTVEELVALALVLDTTPNRLIFGPRMETPPDHTDKAVAQLSEAETATHRLAWTWAHGDRSIGPTTDEESLEFQKENRVYREPSSTPYSILKAKSEKVMARVVIEELMMQLFEEGLHYSDVASIIYGETEAVILQNLRLVVPNNDGA